MRIAVLVAGLGLASLAQAAELREVRLWAGPDSTRVVFDLSAPVEHRLYPLSKPERIVIDLNGIARPSGVSLPAESKGLVRALRSGERPDGLRVVLDVTEAVKPKSFILQPSGQYGYRLVVDLEGQAKAEQPPPVFTAENKPVVVAIDAGHGGEDPGARGRNGLLEKDVALQMARKLARMVNAERDMRAVLIRDGDYYVGLRGRIEKARKAQADLFVSIHANSYKDRAVRGTAVYVLSRNGASSEQARWLANHENAADLIGGVDIPDKDDTLAAVLIDIAQSSAREASFDVGGRLLKALGAVNALQRRDVQQAAFVVLKAPDIPSVLIETAFISNEREERLLGDPASQDRLVRSMLDGIKGYFSSYRPMQQVAYGEGADTGRHAAP
ncbi:MAG: N-acetylmuramoyl-L-alanine amidase [Gammaproteobacteria bacterium]|nr:N-acetylmuramoyl-L-alanine amidase [Gammaproteobacteria bacterium]